MSKSMPHSPKTLIMKFGGSAVQTPECFSSLVKIIISKKKEYPQIVTVISAMGNMTDHLISLANRVSTKPPKREYDMLVSTGERISISLLAMALEAQGIKAVSFTGSQSGIITSCDHMNAEIINVKPGRILSSLENDQIAIVAGFQGVSEEREITTLGRGGSDTTAVALATALGAKIEFYKDVKGIFEKDPKHFPECRQFPTLTYAEALEIVNETGGQILHPRAIQLAEKNNLPLHLYGLHDIESPATIIRASSNGLKSPQYEKIGK